MRTDCDVAIVGAGPAGATAARRLALAGARVRLFDRATFPRNKPCGGAISIRALRRFPHLAEPLKTIDTRLISRLHLESPNGGRVELQSDAPAALMIRRIEFDAMLVRLAREAGAEVVAGAEIVQAERTGNGIRLSTRQGQAIVAPQVVAADGANSVVARRLGFNSGWPASHVALDMMEETPFDALRCTDPDLLWVAYGYKQSHGYAYVFPKKNHVNVGIGYVLDHFKKTIDAPPYDLQRGFVGALCSEGVLDGGSDRSRFTPALIPVGGPLPRTADDRVILAGDAGGFVNGFSAEGIYYAMVTGDLAAGALASGRARGYIKSWGREIGAELRDSVRVQRFLFRHPSRIDGLVDGARRHPALALKIVEYAMGRRSYASARRALLLRFPQVAFRLAFAASDGRSLWDNQPSPSGHLAPRL